MKKFLTCGLLAAVFLLHSSFDKKGGDVFQIFWNGKQMHQQFVHASTEVKSLQLPAFGANDRLEIQYSHCGINGTAREIILRGEKNETLKTFRYADNGSSVTKMLVTGKNIGAVKPGKMHLYYRSKELPKEKLLAIIQTYEAVHAKR